MNWQVLLLIKPRDRLTIPLRVRPFSGQADVAQLIKDSHEIHEKTRGSREEGQFVECSTWRVKAVGKTKDLEFHLVETGSVTPSDSAIAGRRMAYFKELGGMVETTVYNGDKLKAGNRIAGPVILEEVATTIVVFPRSEVTVSNLGNYLVELDTNSKTKE